MTEKSLQQDKKETKKVQHVIIDGKHYEWQDQFITGSQIRELGKIPQGYQIFLAIKGPQEDELVKDEDQVDLTMKGIENFYGCKPNTTNG